MKVSYRWLSELVDLKSLSVDELASILVSRGIEVESIESPTPIDDRVVVAEIKKMQAHENASKLSVLDVFDGENTYQVICGANNMKSGDKVALAKQSARLPNGMKIKKTKLRGVLSEGMCCSLEELGLAESSDGIYIVDKNVELGLPVNQIFATDTILDLAISPNRGDELSHLGIARELSYAKGLKLNDLLSNDNKFDTESSDFKVIVESDACVAYYGMEFSGVKIEESPQWLKDLLISIGLRPINNVVDITNFILHGIGQPLHAFDLDTIGSRKIVVKDAEDDFTYTALDEKDYKLTKGDLLITNGKNTLAVAGIIGGKNTEVSNTTKNIFLECAIFEPTRIRKTARRLGLQTDSSYRFERGVAVSQVEDAFWYASKLIKELASPDRISLVAPYTANNVAELVEEKNIPISLAEFNEFVGITLSDEKFLSLLNSNGYKYTGIVSELLVDAPKYRLDVRLPADVYEDIAKYYGYDKIEAYLPKYFEVNNARPSEKFDFMTKLRGFLSDFGLNELVSYSFVSKDTNKVFGAKSHIPILNPIAEDFTEMRESLLASIMPIVNKNINNGNKSLALFELAKIFGTKNSYNNVPEPNLTPYYEQESLCIVLNGTDILNKHWNTASVNYDYFYLKGILERLGAKLKLSFEFNKPKEELTYTNPFRTSAIYIDEEYLGILGEFAPSIQSKYKLSKNACFLEINLDKLFDKAKNTKLAYEKYSIYPSVRRDISMLVDDDFSHNDIVKLIYSANAKFLTDVMIYDVYRGENIPKTKKAMAYALIFNSMDKTLTDKDVDKDFKKVITVLENSDKISMK